MDYELQEGGIALPAGFEDRTVNMFVLGTSVPAPLSITISRDTLLPDEALQAYVDRQVKMLTSSCVATPVWATRPSRFLLPHPLLVFRSTPIT